MSAIGFILPFGDTVFFPGASKLDASESASEQEEDFELISDEELRSATNEEEENENDDDGDDSK